MIDLNLYRCRIGTFNQRSSQKISKFCGSEDLYPNFMKLILLLMKIILVAAIYITYQHSLITPSASSYLENVNSCSDLWYNWTGLVGLTGNFFARYLYGNIDRKDPKGIRVFHLNIRSLQNKVLEVKNIVKEKNPHILGISECELKKISRTLDVEKLKVPGYNIVFPKSWEAHGYARVVVYIKKTLEYSRVEELEDENLQTIWLKCGFKNSKPGFYCNGYREHTSSLGSSIADQKRNLILFLEQWEKALSFGNPAEPNDIFILCDMNLDSFNGRWLQPDYHLHSLSQLVNSFCNTSNVTQLVKEITRSQFNSVANKTDLSCIDHIYSNVPYRCSTPTVTTSGCSDHDMIGVIRLSKEPPSVPRTIRKRSYKTFNKEKFLEDLAREDWNEVLACPDLDECVSIFTYKFRQVLNVHAPWVRFQQKKHFKPWITDRTKGLMKERDSWEKNSSRPSHSEYYKPGKPRRNRCMENL